MVLVDLPCFGRPTRLVLKASVALSKVSAVVDGAGLDDRFEPLRNDGTGGAVGDVAGRPPRGAACRN